MKDSDQQNSICVEVHLVKACTIGDHESSCRPSLDDCLSCRVLLLVVNIDTCPISHNGEARLSDHCWVHVELGCQLIFRVLQT